MAKQPEFKTHVKVCFASLSRNMTNKQDHAGEDLCMYQPVSAKNSTDTSN